VNRPRWRSELWRFLELFALCGFVFVQPLLEVVGGSPDFFIFHGVAGGEVMALVGIVVLVPPVALWAVGVLVGLISRRVRWVVHLGTVAVLLVLLLIELGKHFTGIRGVLLVAAAVLVAGAAVFAYIRLDATRQLLRFAAVGPLVFVVLFTFASPSSAVVLADNRPSTGGAPRVTGPHPPIVMIVLDEFAMLSLLDSSGTIDAERYPNFARLAAGSTWYRNATATSGWTPYAIPSMMTGQWPAEHRAPHYAVYSDNLFTLLGDVYQISANESITELCPPWYCGDGVDRTRGGLNAALAESTSLLGELMSPVDHATDPYDDFAEPTVSERLDAFDTAAQEEPDSRIRDAMAISQPVRYHDFITGLEAPAPAGRPQLSFLHLLMPHTPWTYYPDGMRYELVAGLPVDGQWWGRLALQRYLSQLQYTDRLLGETLDVLEETGRYDDSLLVLTADHGVTLTPGGPAGIRDLETDQPGIVELAWVPLFIKEPGQTEGVVQDGNWQHVDLLPTIADYAGVAVPWAVDGISWRSGQRTDPAKTFYPRLNQPDPIDGPAGFARIMANPTAIPPVSPPPLPELVGTAVAEHPLAEGAVAADVENADSFEDVDLDSGVVPGLVHGTLPEAVPVNTPLAIAVNGRIGAMVPVVDGPEGRHRFAGLVEDPDLFVAGENRLELFLVPDGVTLYRV
jgi:sulfatase-like protein